MNSFILVSKNTNQQEAYLKTFIAEHAISPFDQIIISTEGSVGIEVVRKLQETIFLTPYKGNEKIVVIQNAEKLTTEAQNALLKLLEEPPLFVYIFLCSSTEEVFLPTVISRCKIINLQPNTPNDPNTPNFSLDQHLQILLQGTIAEKLALAEALATDKENLPLWFEKITIFIRQKMLENIATTPTSPTTQHLRVLSSLQEAHKTFAITNVSPRTVLEHCFLQSIT